MRIVFDFIQPPDDIIRDIREENLEIHGKNMARGTR